MQVQRRGTSEAQHCKVSQNQPVTAHHSTAGHGVASHAADQSSTANTVSAKGQMLHFENMIVVKE